MLPKVPFPQTHHSRQTAVALENSRVALHRGGAMLKANEKVLRLVQTALAKSSEAIVATRHALAEQTSPQTARKRRGF